MRNAIEINNLIFKWDNKNEFNLKIKKLVIKNKKKIIIFGKSGSGKSTLLNLISGILTPSLGTIVIKNVKVNELSQKKKTRLELTM